MAATTLLLGLILAAALYLNAFDDRDAVELGDDQPERSAPKISRPQDKSSPTELTERTPPPAVDLEVWRLQGRVVNSDGAGQNSVKVMILAPSPRQDPQVFSEIIASTLSDAEGFFSCSLSQNPHRNDLVLFADAETFGFEIQSIPLSHQAWNEGSATIVLEHPRSLGILVGVKDQVLQSIPVILEFRPKEFPVEQVIRIAEATDDTGIFKCFDYKRHRGIVHFDHPRVGLFSDTYIGNNDRDASGRVIFNLPQGESLLVHFVKRDQCPVNANIRFRALDAEAHHWFLGVSDNQGDALLPSFPKSSTVRIQVLSKDWFLASQDDPSLDPAQGNRFEIFGALDRGTIVTVSKGCEISGRVFAGNSAQALVGVEVECIFPGIGGSRISRRITTDSRGGFHFQSIPGGWNHLSCDRAGYSIDVKSMSESHATMESPFARLAKKLGHSGFDFSARTKVDPQRQSFLVFVSDLTPQHDLVLRVLAAGSVQGKVVDDRGQGLAGVRVGLMEAKSLFRNFSKNQQSNSELSALSDEHGEFRILEVPVGKWKATCNPPHQAWTESAVFEVHSKKVRAGVHIQLKATKTLSIQVQNESGLPLAGIQIAVRERGQGINLTQYTLDTLISDSEGLATTLKLTDGEYWIEMKELESHDLILRGGQRSTVTTQELAAGRKTIVLSPVRYLRGRIVDESRKPIAKGFVTFQVLDDDGKWVALSYRMTQTNDKGEFLCAVADAGNYRVIKASVPSSNGTREYLGDASSTFSSDTYAPEVVLH